MELEAWRDSIVPHGHGQQRSTDRLKARQLLHAQMRMHLSWEDLRTLCFDLDVDFDDLGGDGKDDRIRDLILLAVQQGLAERLLGRLAEIRPQVHWPTEIN